MTIKVLTEPDVYVSKADLERYTRDYDTYVARLGAAPLTLEEYIQHRQRQERDGK